MKTFSEWLLIEGQIDAETLHQIWLKATTEGISVYRGERPKQFNKPYSSDPGDFGRGIYYTTSGHRAAAYGETSQKIIKFQNPLVLSVEDAYNLADKYKTIRATVHFSISGDPLENAEKMTKDMLSKGYDGLISVSRRPRFRKDKKDYMFKTHESNGGELEIVDYRPYR